MSSSRVFRDDTSFVPITLVSEEIVPGQETPTADREEPVPPPVRPEEQPQSDEAPVRETQPEDPPPVDEPVVDLEAIREEAYRQGAADALQDLGSRLHSAVEAFVRGSEQLQELHRTIREQSRGNLINTVMALTRKIVQRELTTDRETVVAILEAALDRTLESSECVITVHPDDLALVREQEPVLLERMRSLEHIVCKADPEIEAGGCRVETSACLVDASIERQLEAARNFLEQNLREDNGDEPIPGQDQAAP